MIKQARIQIAAALLLVLFAHFAMASFSGTDDKSKYNLKNLSFLSKNYSLSTLRSSQFKFFNSQDFVMRQSNNRLEVNSIIRLQNGNTTYVYPYKYVIKLPKFKTPTLPPQ